jgi:acetyl esterase/lipase
MNKSIYFALTVLLLLASCSNDNNATATPQDDTPSVTLEASYTVNITQNITYANGLSHDDLNSANASVMPLLLDAYVPDNELENRPVLMLVHGGGFTGGSKEQEALVNLAKYFSERGFVVFSIDYRLLSNRGTIPQEWIANASNIPPDVLLKFYALYPAHRDAKAALRWIVANANSYNINTDYITIGGGSAGATTAIGIGVSELGDYRDEISLNIDSTLATTNLSQTYSVQTILDFWGSSNSIEALELVYGVQRFGANNPALFIAHGTADPTVLFSEAEELRSIYQANQVPFVFYELTGAGHGAWNAEVDGKRLEKLAFDYVVAQQNLSID